MNPKEETILVIGATGRQGGAALRHLIKEGWNVRAFTRNRSKAINIGLEKQGAEIIQGDLEDRGSLEKALKGAYGVFAVLNYWEHGAEGEVRQGKNLADMALKAGVRHYVYSSVGGVERHTGIPHFDSKQLVERYVEELKLPWTFVRPVWFMENFCAPESRSEILDGRLRNAMDPKVPLQMIAVDDIGAISAMLFRDPGKWMYRSLEIAGDALTMPETAAALSEAIGRDVRFEPVPMDKLMTDDTRLMFEWFNEHGYEADIESLKTLYPGLRSFREWLRESGWGRTRPD